MRFWHLARRGRRSSGVFEPGRGRPEPRFQGVDALAHAPGLLEPRGSTGRPTRGLAFEQVPPKLYAARFETTHPGKPGPTEDETSSSGVHGSPKSRADPAVSPGLSAPPPWVGRVRPLTIHVVAPYSKSGWSAQDGLFAPFWLGRKARSSRPQFASWLRMARCEGAYSVRARRAHLDPLFTVEHEGNAPQHDFTISAKVPYWEPCKRRRRPSPEERVWHMKC
jgi:hypothetical protein